MLFALSLSQAQQEVSPLFQSETPIVIQLHYSMRDVKRDENDTVFFRGTLLHQREEGNWDTLAITLQGRGHFRRDNCSFTPLRIKIKKKESHNTPFSGNKTLKLVIPCQNGKLYNELIIKEYICYKLNEIITPYFFNTRMAAITLFDGKGKQTKFYNLKGFFIEDDDLVADRFGGKILDNQSVHPMKISDTLAMKLDFFEYMISNVDWSLVQQHNVKIMQLNSPKYIPLAYDFDMSGFVDAPYATVSELINAKTVRERVYRGYCRPSELFKAVRSTYLELEPKLLQVLDDYKDELSSSERSRLKEYLEEFFSILKSDKNFQASIESQCRTK